MAAAVKGDLALVVPSRSRPWNIARLWEAMGQTCRGDTTLVVGLDQDDPLRESYPPGPEYVVRDGLRYVVPWINELAVPAAREYRFVGHIGDDNVPRTVGWDVSLTSALADTPFSFGNDLYPRTPGSLCCHLFCRSEVILALGYLGPPGFRHMFVDNVWMAWGTAVGITYLHDVVLEHMHYTVGKAPVDESYLASTALMGEGQGVYNAYMAAPDGLRADIRKLGDLV